MREGATPQTSCPKTTCGWTPAARRLAPNLPARAAARRRRRTLCARRAALARRARAPYAAPDTCP
eukprot:5040487-Pyramimonas_sp.AAC.1